jgi:DNA-binding transcriptional regulator YhcF (GntR family)
MEKDAFIVTESQGLTKIQSLLDSLTGAIASGKFSAGDKLPSVNELSRKSGFSRDTVVKAYHLLKERSLVESVPAKGFFVSGGSSRIFLLLDDFSAFKEQLYQAFRANIPKSWTVDLLFHHYNAKVFEQLVLNAAGRYNMYVVMNISNRSLHPVLSRIDPNKLLVLDMGSGEKTGTNYLLQNFDQSVQECLDKSISVLRKYREIILIYSGQKTPHPSETVKAVREFCQKRGFVFRVYPEFNEKNLKKGQMYMVIKESDLVEVVRSCRKKELTMGMDVGVLAYNDTPMKEIAGNGITTISVNFSEMGKKAAFFVTKKQKIREFLPTSLIIRHSL